MKPDTPCQSSTHCSETSCTSFLKQDHTRSAGPHCGSKAVQEVNLIGTNHFTRVDLPQKDSLSYARRSMVRMRGWNEASGNWKVVRVEKILEDLDPCTQVWSGRPSLFVNLPSSQRVKAISNMLKVYYAFAQTWLSNFEHLEN